ncbi:hypothetical protein VTK73DRAFT_6210 [Phialemonium thermophilum]|uniref:N(6)-L-threonylcarbamoyladenine synthase n=1 Tax=Phialemonium thermophilum TaxID=223376 RepID=A0ABR3XW02_9PEZI
MRSVPLWVRVKGSSMWACFQPSPRLQRSAPFPGHLSIRKRPRSGLPTQTRQLVTLAIETSCDDTCVAVLEKHPTNGAARLLFERRLTSDNRAYGGVHPVVAVNSHVTHLANLVQEAVRHIPASSRPRDGSSLLPSPPVDFVSVTRGPGMLANLATGLNTAKGVAAAWDVPVLGVNHMQAHALTPRLAVALERGRHDQDCWSSEGRILEDTPTGAGAEAELAGRAPCPAFPFLSLLVSGGHTMLLLSRDLCSHKILVPDSGNLAIGDMLDKCARAILPPDVLASVPDTMYAAALETFAFPDASPPRSASNSDSERTRSGADYEYDYDYTPPAHRADEILAVYAGNGVVLTPPLAGSRALNYNFTGLGTQVARAMAENPHMSVPARRAVARATMRVAFEHLAGRILLCLSSSTRSRSLKPSYTASDGAKTRDNGCGRGDNVAHTDSSTATTAAVPQGTSPNDLNSSIRAEVAAARTLVVSGGVARNRFLMHVLRMMLRARGPPASEMQVVAPPPALCTDNAAMIAWAGAEMWEAGWRSELSILPVRKWSLDPESPDGGILGAKGWVRRDG